jgi:transcriptional regulator with XRE-family HTH domain
MDGRARIAWNLRRIRSTKRVSQEVLAVDADVDRSYISGIEQQQFNPSIDVLDRLAAALAVDVSEFLILPETTATKPQPLPPGRKADGR